MMKTSSDLIRRIPCAGMLHNKTVDQLVITVEHNSNQQPSPKSCQIYNVQQPLPGWPTVTRYCVLSPQARASTPLRQRCISALFQIPPISLNFSDSVENFPNFTFSK